MVYFFQAGAFFAQIRQILPILANLGYFVANLGTSCRSFTGLNNAVVSQYLQIPGVTPT